MRTIEAPGPGRLRAGAAYLAGESWPLLACLLVPAAIVLAIALSGASPAVIAEPAASLPPGPYAGFRFEQVGVGVKRLIDDGAGHRPGDWDLFRGTRADLVAVEPDGSVLKCCDRPNVFIEARDETELHRLGDAEPAAAWDGSKVRMGDITDLAVAGDGTIWAAGRGVASLVDGEWQRLYRDAESALVVAGDDGTVWAEVSGKALGLLRVDGGRRRLFSAGAGLPKATQAWGKRITGIAPTPNGEAWVGVSAGRADPGGLLHFDGQRWRIVYPLGRGVAARVYGVASAPDGTVWVYLSADSRKTVSPKRPTAHLARFDGGAWTVFDENTGVPPLRRRWIDTDIRVPMQVGPDGTLWLAPPIEDGCSRLMRFDGDWVTAHLGDSTCVHDLGVDREGRAWVSVAEWFASSGAGSRVALYLIEP